MNNKLNKSSRDKVFQDVCGGIAEFFGISPLAVRLIFIVLPANVVIYLLLSYTMVDIGPSL
ncbi:phage-shock protein [Pontibacillus halophilus JSM 076056 = DSM 19796]|uniref:Phage-shock protein n=1 Tax=Pontibacillus halophilus JSM 076056 = DSM 19796 TaxID=1385510 RepID=A0A0A5GJF6_9BACI|nr:PspC domain-containing protein [Pontibacillus halophilus]KGX92119.1 phage-shock protein [Pontibacillus halophilus JSM 076056 = DSM 19796]